MGCVRDVLLTRMVRKDDARGRTDRRMTRTAVDSLVPAKGDTVARPSMGGSRTGSGLVRYSNSLDGTPA